MIQATQSVTITQPLKEGWDAMYSNEAGHNRQFRRSKEKCGHKKLLDDELSEKGEKTGNLICLECGAILCEQSLWPQRISAKLVG